MEQGRPGLDKSYGAGGSEDDEDAFWEESIAMNPGACSVIIGKRVRRED